MQHSNGYTILFAGAVCLVFSIMVAGSAVALKDTQEANKLLDRQTKILTVAGIMKEGERWPAEKITSEFATQLRAVAVDLKTGTVNTEIDPATYDQRKSAKDPKTSTAVPKNWAQVARVPKYAVVYHQIENGRMKKIILPIEGKGLWSTLYGFLALAPDGDEVEGITFYEHAETPGLGGEVDNPRWKALWPGRKVHDASGKVALRVIKGPAGPAASDPNRVDGLSGATMTSRGVTYLVQFWLGEYGFKKYLQTIVTDDKGEGQQHVE